MVVRVTLLGRPTIEVDGRRWEPAADHRSALLYYLAGAGGWVPRDDLLALFWPDRPEYKARAALRQLLARTAKQRFAVSLRIERTRVRWEVSTDAEALVTACPALATWPGGFLDGFRIPDAPEYDDWLALERSAWEGRWRVWALRTATGALASDRAEHACDVLDAWLLRDPFDEAAFRAWCEASLRLGRRAAAAQRYQAFESSLRSELGVDPRPATRAAALGGGVPASDGADPTSTAPHSTPTTTHPSTLAHATGAHGTGTTTELVGRADELAFIDDALKTPGSVVAIVGAGGMGKTSLAVAAAHRLGAQRDHGASVASLGGARNLDDVGQALRGALGIPLVPGRRPLDLAIEALRARRAVVVLDEVDSLIDPAATFAQLRQAAAGVDWLLTSRRHVDIDGSTTLELHGLACPTDAADVPHAPAAALLLRRVERVGAKVDPRSDADAVVAICRACGGMPLALELAAGWARVLPLRRIAEELGVGIDLLQAAGSRADCRHGSVRAVLESAWATLPDTARRLLVELSVCRDGFDDDAAREVANAGLPQLLALRNASFITLDADGRFRQHPLLAAFVRERAALASDLSAAAEARHARCFLARLERWERDGHGDEPASVMAALQRDHGNVEAAWRYAVAHGWWDALKAGGPTLGLSYALAGRPQRWSELHREALAVVPADTAAWAMLEIFDSAIAGFEGRTAEAYERRGRALATLRRCGTERDLAWALFRFGLGAEAIDQDDEAIASLEEAAALYGRLEEPDYRGLVLTLLHSFSRTLTEADERFTVADMHHRATGNRGNRAELLANHASITAQMSGRYDAALELVDEAVRLERALSWSPMQVAVHLRASAWIRLDAGDVSGAHANACEALHLWRPFQAQFPHGTHDARVALASAAWLLGDADGVVEHLPAGSPAASTLDALVVRSWVALEQGDHPTATACAAAALARTSDTPTRWQQRRRRIAALTANVRLSAATNDRAAALAWLQEAVRLAQVDPLVPSLLAVSAAALPLVGDDAEPIVAALRHHPAVPYASRRALPAAAGAAPALRTSQAAPNTSDAGGIADAIASALADHAMRSSPN